MSNYSNIVVDRQRILTDGSTSIDRRTEYYMRAASTIAADPDEFYRRAEKGRRYLNWLFSPRVRESQPAPEEVPTNVIAMRRVARG